MRKLLFLLMLLTVTLPALGQTPRVITTGTDPDGQACTLATPPIVLVYHTGSTVELCSCQSSLWSCSDAIGSGAAPAFSAITSATNTTATMTVGTGASITTSGSGAIDATTAPFSGLTAGTSTGDAFVVGAGSSLTTAVSGSIVATTGDSATSFFSSGTLEDARLPASMAAKTLTGATVIQDDLTVGDGTDANWTLTVNRTSTDATFAWDDTENDWVFGGGGNSDGNIRLKEQSTTNQSGIMMPVSTPTATDWWIGGGSATFNSVHDSMFCTVYNANGCNTSPAVSTEHRFGWQLEATYAESASQEQSEWYLTFAQADTTNYWRPFSGDVEYLSGGAKVGFGSDTNGRAQIDFSTSYAQYSEAVAPRQFKMEYTGASTFNANSQQGRSANLNVGIYTHNTFDGPELDDGIKIEMDLEGDGTSETVTNARMIEILPSIPGSNYALTTYEGLRFSDWGTMEGTSSISQAFHLYLGDMENVAGDNTWPLYIASQTDDNDGGTGNSIWLGMNWDTGHLAVGSIVPTAADHLWRDQTTECWRTTTDSEPGSETAGSCLLEGTDTVYSFGMNDMDGTLDYAGWGLPTSATLAGTFVNIPVWRFSGHNADCTATPGEPYACCTGSGAGTCTTETCLSGPNFKVPDNADTAVSVTAEIWWTPESAQTNAIRWFIAQGDQDDNETWDQLLRAGDFVVTSTYSSGADATLVELASTSAAYATTGWAAGDMITWYLCRDADHAGDTLTDDADVHMVNWKIRTTKP